MSIDKGSLTDDPPARSSAAVLAVAVVALSVFLMALKPVRSPDVWHHVKSGWFVVQNRGPASVDVFSCTANGQPWIQYEWLAQLIIYGIYQAAGATGLVLFQAAAAALVALLLMAAIRARPRAGWAAAALADGPGALRGLAAILRAAGDVHVDPLRRVDAGGRENPRRRRAAAAYLLRRFRPHPHGSVGQHARRMAGRAGVAGPGLRRRDGAAAFPARRGAAEADRAAALGGARPGRGRDARQPLRRAHLGGAVQAGRLAGSEGRHRGVAARRTGRTGWTRVTSARGFSWWPSSRRRGGSRCADALVVLFFGALALSARRHLALAMIAVAPVAAAQFSVALADGSRSAWPPGLNVAAARALLTFSPSRLLTFRLRRSRWSASRSSWRRSAGSV